MKKILNIFLILCIVVSGYLYINTFTKEKEITQQAKVESVSNKDNSNEKDKKDTSSETKDKKEVKNEVKNTTPDDKSKELKDKTSKDKISSDKKDESKTKDTSSGNKNDNNKNNENTPLENSSTEESENKAKNTATISISCKTAINNGVNKEVGFTHLPSNGVILKNMTVEFEDGDTVYDVLQRTVKQNGIHMEYTGSRSTIYIEGIDNLYEFDGGKNSGWMYSVNGWYPNYGCGSYKLKDKDIIQWNYTCDLGADLGQTWVGN